MPTGRQAGTERDRPTDRQAARQTHGQTKTGKQADRRTVRKPDADNKANIHADGKLPNRRTYWLTD